MLYIGTVVGHMELNDSDQVIIKTKENPLSIRIAVARDVCCEWIRIVSFTTLFLALAVLSSDLDKKDVLQYTSSFSSLVIMIAFFAILMRLNSCYKLDTDYKSTYLVTTVVVNILCAIDYLHNVGNILELSIDGFFSFYASVIVSFVSFAIVTKLFEFIENKKHKYTGSAISKGEHTSDS